MRAGAMAGTMFSIENLLGTAKVKSENFVKEEEAALKIGEKRRSISYAEMDSCNGDDSDKDSIVSGEGTKRAWCSTVYELRLQCVGCDFIVVCSIIILAVNLNLTDKTMFCRSSSV